MLYFYRTKYDFLRFDGSDRLDLINRLSTNEVKSLEKNRGVKTILTSDKGRIIDVLSLYNFGDFIFAMCSSGNTKAITGHLDKYTIMDDFKSTDMAGTHEARLIWGDSSAEFCKKAFGADITTLENNDFLFCNDGERHSILARNDDAFGGAHFIYDAKDKDFWNGKIDSVNKESEYSFSEVTDNEYDSMRIDLGIPAFGKEMTEKVNPLECGLGNYVSFTKGCYIGQEVIARLDAYDKISRHLVKLRAESEIPVSENNGDIKILTDGKECGFVTSAGYMERTGHIGLGFVKTVSLDFDKEYQIKFENKLIHCNIIAAR